MEDYGAIIDKPLQIGGNVLAQMTKKLAASRWAMFKRFLSTASEPLLRKDMGERYLSGEAVVGGSLIWILATIVALVLPFLRSGWALLNDCTVVYGYQFRFAVLLNHWSFTLLVGGALVVFHWKFGVESLRKMLNFREEGAHYHTQSRGVERWNDKTVPLAILMVLAMFNLPAAVLFVASRSMSAKIASEQQAAIYSRYLDALDARIEQEYLENAILGKCPTEITQLHRPLAANMNEDLRKNIAAAAVGKQVTLIQKTAKRTGAGASGGPGFKPPSGPAPENMVPPDVAADTRPESPPPASASAFHRPTMDSIISQTAAKVVVEKAAKSAGRAISAVPGILASKQFLRVTVALLVLLSIAVVGIFGFELIQSHRQSQPKTPVIQSQNISVRPVARSDPKPIPVPVAPPASTTPTVTLATSLITEAPSDSPPQAAVAVQDPPAKTTTAAALPAKTNATLAPVVPTTIAPVLAAPETVPSQNNDKRTASPKTAIAAAVDALNTFSNYCLTTLVDDNGRIGKIANNGIRDKLGAASVQIQSWTGRMISHQQEYLESLTSDANGEASVTRSIEKLNTDRDSVTNALMRFDTDIYNAGLRR